MQCVVRPVQRFIKKAPKYSYRVLDDTDHERIVGVQIKYGTVFFLYMYMSSGNNIEIYRDILGHLPAIISFYLSLGHPNPIFLFIFQFFFYLYQVDKIKLIFIII